MVTFWKIDCYTLFSMDMDTMFTKVPIGAAHMPHVHLSGIRIALGRSDSDSRGAGSLLYGSNRQPS
jgi:hypothetical protein